MPVPTQAPAPSPSSTPEPTATVDYSNFNRRTPFVPLDNPAFLAAEQATYLPGDDLVLGLVWDDERRAYPIRMLRFHHIVNDSVPSFISEWYGWSAYHPESDLSQG